MSEIAVMKVSITTAGSAGSATGSGSTIPINGYLLDVYLDYHASCPTTADVTVADAVFGNIIVKSNNASDVWLSPRKQTCDQAAADTGLYDLIPLNGTITISIAQADALTACVVAYIRWMTV